MRILRFAIVAAAMTLAASFGAPALAQPSGSIQAQTPMTRDLGAIQTLTAQVPGTVASVDQNGYNVSRVICVMRQSAQTGGSAASFSIQNKDAASGQYYSLITSGSMTVNGQVSPISAGAGITTVSNVSSNTHPIARTWRTSVTVTGGTNWSGTVGCSVQ